MFSPGRVTRLVGSMLPVALLLVASSLASPAAAGASAPQASDHSMTARSFRAWLQGPVNLFLTVEEAEIIPRLATSSDRAAFVDWFWSRRDPDPSTTRNEFRERIQDRLAYVTKEFEGSGSGHAGWSTVAGKIYMVLGPPSEQVTRQMGAVTDAGAQRVTLWTYLRDSGDYWLRVPLVETAEGYRLLDTRGAPVGQSAVVEAMKEAVEGAVVQPDLPLPSRARVNDVGALPVRQTRLLDAPDGVWSEVRLPIGELYGVPRDDEVQIQFRVEVLFDGNTAEPVLLPLRFALDSDEFASLRDSELIILVWIDESLGSGSRLRLEETASGRRATVSAGDGALEDVYPVGEFLGVGLCPQESGYAVAFTEAPGAERAAGTLWLVRDTGGAIDGTDQLPTLRKLRLVRLGS